MPRPLFAEDHPITRAGRVITGGTYTGGPFKIVHHTTEGSLESALATYPETGNIPHFTVHKGRILQHLDTARSATALRNEDGGVQTNRDSAVQIEVVGFAKQPKDPETLASVAKLCRWIEETHQVARDWPNGFPTAPGAPENRNATTWNTRSGHYGHCHVPENDHDDPGYTRAEVELVMGSEPVSVFVNGALVANARAFLDDSTVWLAARAVVEGAMGGQVEPSPDLITVILSRGRQTPFAVRARGISSGVAFIPARELRLLSQVAVEFTPGDPPRVDITAPGAAPGAAPSPLVSAVLRNDPVLTEVAAGAEGAEALVATGAAVQGIAPVQDALNLLAKGNPEFGIELGGNRGAFGPRTERAVRAFQQANGLPATGRVDAATLLALDAQVVALLQDVGEEGVEFSTPAATAETRDGSGGSTTTGLHGRKTSPAAGVELIEAVETLSARRDHKSLGDPKAARQTRRKQDGVTEVTQHDYCWGGRALPDARLTDRASGLSSEAGAFAGRATFFGKGDDQDEGTGTPAFGRVQTNSSVFGISLPKKRLINEGLATVKADGALEATAKGLAARVEVFFAGTGRRALLPLVDVGPSPTVDAVADLTVAATAFLQGKTEEQLRQLDNITVRLRVV
jgi:peptidoglycan hydrolase-like protein with peptidoglycan-binding domain